MQLRQSVAFVEKARKRLVSVLGCSWIVLAVVGFSSVLGRNHGKMQMTTQNWLKSNCRNTKMKSTLAKVEFAPTLQWSSPLSSSTCHLVRALPGSLRALVALCCECLPQTLCDHANLVSGKRNTKGFLGVPKSVFFFQNLLLTFSEVKRGGKFINKLFLAFWEVRGSKAVRLQGGSRRVRRGRRVRTVGGKNFVWSGPPNRRLRPLFHPHLRLAMMQENACMGPKLLLDDNMCPSLSYGWTSCKSSKKTNTSLPAHLACVASDAPC